MRAMMILALGLLTMGGCNTVSGIGKDISAFGSGVTGASNYVRYNLFASRETADTVTVQSSNRPAAITFRERASVSVGEACDPSAELAGGSGLPPCRATVPSRGAPNSSVQHR